MKTSQLFLIHSSMEKMMRIETFCVCDDSFSFVLEQL